MPHATRRPETRMPPVLPFIVPVLCAVTSAAALRLPVAFEENRGQVAPEVAFVSRTAMYRAFLTRRGAILSSNDGQSVRVSLAGARDTAPVGAHRVLAKTNYLSGANATDWKTGIPNYERVIYPQVYAGIDMTWHAQGEELEHDFVVAAGADPGRVRLVFSGAAVRLTSDGDLQAGPLRFRKPRAYQGAREIDCRYELAGRSVRFALGPYDRAHPLTIDPVLSFSTYLGETNDQGTRSYPVATALDGAGNVYVAGTTASLRFPTTAGAFQPKPGGGTCGGILGPQFPCDDVFVMKFSGDGKTLLYATYLGGASADFMTAIAVGPAGNLYLLGNTNTAYWLPGVPPASGYFLVELSADGASLLRASVPSIGVAVPAALTVDAAGAVYLTGSTQGQLSTVNAFQPTRAGAFDAFAMKLDATNWNVVYSTYLGGTGNDYGHGIAVDAAGRAYIAGETTSPDFPLTAPLQPVFGGNGNSDAFVTVLDPSGSQLVWSTYLGGSAAEVATSIALDSAGNVHLAGYVMAANTSFPTSPPPAYPPYAFAAKIKGDGSAEIFSAQLADTLSPMGRPCVAADAAGNTYIADSTSSNARPTVNALQPTLAGTANVYVAEYDGQTGALQFATYLGGSGSDFPNSLSADAAGDLYLAGWAGSNFPLKNPWQSSPGNIFIAKVGATRSVTGLSSAASESTTVAPGELVSIFGTALASSIASAAQLPLPTQLSDVQVTVNGIAAPLIYVSPQQVNAQIPFETQPGIAQVQVSSSGGTSTITVPVAATAPAIFTLNQQGTGAGAILHGSTYQVVTDQNPAAPGEFVSIYCTGLGAVDPAVPTGAVPPNPPPQVVIPVQVSIAGAAAPVIYQGVAPGFAGLYQVNAQIPLGTSPGAQPLRIIQNGVASNTVTVSVQ